MQKQSLNKDEIIDAIRSTAKKLGKRPSRSEFVANTGIGEYHVLKYYPNWNSAVEAAGFEPDTTNVKKDNSMLLEDWGKVVRQLRQIPTRVQYKHHGTFSTSVFEKHFGPWSQVPDRFREFAVEKSEWNDVLALLPVHYLDAVSNRSIQSNSEDQPVAVSTSVTSSTSKVHSKLDGRPVYGNPIDFRGLRHEPVNENGVIFLFGIVARELGYSVESVQSGFPDCEAKRQINVGKWQRVRIEFEYESRNFRDHGHSPEQCDIIVCWRHNWPECPRHIEVLELSKVIKQLAKSEE